jgi:hypothetical protein
MSRPLIALILIIGFLISPEPTISVAVKKACCCSPGSTSDCARHGDGKSDCCGPTVVSVPIVIGLANVENFEHPVQPQKPLIWTEAFSSRSEAPLLPPPKVV